jgi:dynein heavy chain, axonemal
MQAPVHLIFWACTDLYQGETEAGYHVDEGVQAVKREEAKVQEKAAAAKAIKDECEAELSVAMPILQVRVSRQSIHCMEEHCNPMLSARKCIVTLGSNRRCCAWPQVPAAYLQDALAALDTIKEADVAYIRKLGNPPGAIKLVMEAVCVILGVKPAKGKDESGKTFDDWWKPSVALLNEKDFLQKLKGYDKDNIPPKVHTGH